MDNVKTVSAVVPAYNEAAVIADTLEALKNIPEIKEIIVVDDGSTDNTAEIALAQGARVFRLSKNRGKGEAIWRGAPIARSPLLALVDADLGYSAREIGKLIKPVTQGQADMAVAVFPPVKNRGGFGMVKALSRRGIFLLAGMKINEPLSGQRVLTTEIIREMKRPPRGFGLEVALTLNVLRRGYRITEVQTGMSHRERGRDIQSFIHRGRQFAAVCNALWHGMWERLLKRT